MVAEEAAEGRRRGPFPMGGTAKVKIGTVFNVSSRLTGGTERQPLHTALLTLGLHRGSWRHVPMADQRQPRGGQFNEELGSSKSRGSLLARTNLRARYTQL